MEFNKSWNEYILYDLANWKNGLAFKDINFSNKGKPIIKIAELKNGITEQTKYTDGDYGEEVYLSKNDLIFSWSGNPKTSIDAFLYDLPEGYLNQHSFKITEKKEIVAKYFLYYVLKYLNPVFQSIASDKQTTGLGHVTITDLKKIKVRIPDLDVQYKILDIVKNIDDKIYNNNQINDNLQKFGLEMITQEMKKDASNNLRNIIRFIKGKKPLNISKNQKENYLPYLTIANLNNQENLYASIEKVLIAEKDLLMVMDGASSGDIYYSDYGIVGSTLAKIEILDDRYNQASIYFIIKYFSEYIKSKNTGSAIPHTDKEIVYKLIVPDIYNQKIYENILNTILENNKQNKKLEQLRDTLLPKLMNGEIDLDKIEI